MAHYSRVGNEGRTEKIKASPKLGHHHQQCGRSAKELHKNSNGHHVCARSPQEQLTNGVKGQNQTHQGLGKSQGQHQAHQGVKKKVEFASQLKAEGGDNEAKDAFMMIIGYML